MTIELLDLESYLRKSSNRNDEKLEAGGCFHDVEKMLGMSKRLSRTLLDGRYTSCTYSFKTCALLFATRSEDRKSLGIFRGIM
jgi:hypothetical protein